MSARVATGVMICDVIVPHNVEELYPLALDAEAAPASAEMQPLFDRLCRVVKGPEIGVYVLGRDTPGVECFGVSPAALTPTDCIEVAQAGLVIALYGYGEGLKTEKLGAALQLAHQRRVPTRLFCRRSDECVAAQFLGNCNADSVKLESFTNERDLEHLAGNFCFEVHSLRTLTQFECQYGVPPEAMAALKQELRRVCDGVQRKEIRTHHWTISDWAAIWRRLHTDEPDLFG